MEKYSKEKLEKLILEDNLSYEAIGKIYGVTGNAIKKAALSRGIELPQRRKINDNEKFSHKGSTGKSLVDSISDEDFINVIQNSVGWKEISKNLGYSSSLSKSIKDKILDRCSKLDIEIVIHNKPTLLFRTKKDLFSDRKNWQSARSSIVRNAHNTYMASGKPKCCAICGYSNHIEIAHIKAVSEFEESSTIAEINSIDNLIALCPNHHWEYDNGIIKL